MEFEPIEEVLPVREQIANTLRKMILTGELKGGEPLKERQLSEIFNVSTTPIKEAFRLLQAEGLINTKPRSGTFVSVFSIESMRQILYMRSALDGVAAYFAAIQATEEDIQYLNSILKEISEMLDSGAAEQDIHVKNEKFHEEIRSLANNDYLSSLIYNIRGIDSTFRTVALSKSIPEQYRQFKEHEAIFQAIRNRDPDRAEHLMRLHIRRVSDYVIRDKDE